MLLYFGLFSQAILLRYVVLLLLLGHPGRRYELPPTDARIHRAWDFIPPETRPLLLDAGLPGLGPRYVGTHYSFIFGQCHQRLESERVLIAGISLQCLYLLHLVWAR